MNRLSKSILPLLFVVAGATLHAETFTPIVPLPLPKIIANAQAFAGGSFEARNILDGDVRTEYASAGKGLGTYIDFDFGHPVLLAGFKHIDRRGEVTVAASQLIFSEEPDFRSTAGTVNVTHVNQSSGTTLVSFPPVTARYVRWQVTKLAAPHATPVGGAEIAFFTTDSVESHALRDTVAIQPVQAVLRENGGEVQPVEIVVEHHYAEPTQALVRVDGAPPILLGLKLGIQKVDIALPAVTAATSMNVALEVGGEVVARCQLARQPVRNWEIYVLPHSHVDIGYTMLQTAVERKQIANLQRALELARETADFPEGSRFKWNVEVMWPVEGYLRQATPEQQQAFFQAVKAGQVGLDALYCNVLTGLCRPEEQMHLVDYGLKIARRCGVPLKSAMISDVPGYTWSTMATLACAGVKYFSFGPNWADRIGYTMAIWPDKPFYWETPDGRHKLLCWCPRWGYALGHIVGEGPGLAKFVPGYLRELTEKGYPYDITYVRWNVHGDNGSPDEKIAGVVRQWNETHVRPKLIIATADTAFAALEQRYGNKLPVFRGDYTPFWEDGAGSSARETALNRQSAERLVQAETLWALLRPTNFPADDFYAAWRNVLLYSEHTWGSRYSISQPDLPIVKDQWKIKQGFAVDADSQSQRLLARALGSAEKPTATAAAINVYNTNSWLRTDLVVLPRDRQWPGARVEDASGKAVPSQQLSTGELAFLAADVPPLAARRFTVKPGPAAAAGNARATGSTITTSDLTLQVDQRTGAIQGLRSRRLGVELVDSQAPTALNDYFYLPGANLADLQRNGPVTISVKEPGPLVASLVVQCDAPGCNRLTREIRLVDGLDRVDLVNQIDKKAIRDKEGVHFGFAFHVPNGTVRMDVGWAVVRPNEDQLPAACKNWFSVQRWLDVSNAEYGVTWAPLDVPLVEVGGITANLIGSQMHPEAWMDHVPASQTIYSWVMNNHWHTNYCADQQGSTTFRYCLCPHGPYDPAAAARFGIGRSQPLIAAACGVDRGPLASRLTIEPAGVLLTDFAPSRDGKAVIVRLFGAGGKAEKAVLHWADPVPVAVWRSDLDQRPLERISGPIEVPAWGIVTIRAELP